MMTWLNADEKVPNNSRSVLLVDGSFIKIGNYIPEYRDDYPDGSDYLAAHWIDERSGETLDSVTHWKDLPKIPKK